LFQKIHDTIFSLVISTWPSNHHHPKTLIGLRILSSEHLECYIPSPALSNIITSCLPVFSSFTNRTISPLRLINRGERNPVLLSSSETMFQHDSIYYCFYTLPPTLHLSIILLSLILTICAALAIQDNASGLHPYSLIHGLHSPIHWCITFLSDLILCLIWLLILILIARFVHSSTFNSRFFLLTPLFFIVNLPFIYLMAKVFQVPVLGATLIIFILQLAHVLYTFKVFIELFRAYRTLSTLIHGLRWLLLLIFPNVNVFTLIVAILRKTSCPLDDLTLEREGDEFSHEHYPYKILIHTFIFITQFILYFIVLIMLDIWKIRCFGGEMKGGINQKEDNDVTEERHRIESMSDEDKQHEAVVVDNLSKQFRGSSIPAVNRLTFAVPHRQCFGLLGFNGSGMFKKMNRVLCRRYILYILGKTTTFRMLIKELQPTAGYVYRNNKESIGYCPQDDISFSALTVIQSINYICRLHGIKPISLNNLILTQFQLEKYRHYLISNLSGGTRRRLHLALCLIGSPTLLLLDEPTAKVDPLLRRHIRVILQHRPVDTSIIFASHSMLECEQLCDRLTILVRGNAQCLGSLEHLKSKYGTDYRIRLTLLQPSYQIPLLERVDNSNEYTYPVGSLAHLFTELEQLVEQNIIESNYTVQLTSLEDIFLTFQHSSEIKV
jgi:ABC-type multidrug transport system ATPase subunit